MKVKDENENSKKRKENFHDEPSPSRRKLSTRTDLDDEYIDENYHLLKKQTLKKRRLHRYEGNQITKFSLGF